jgi:hypothetical protein
MHKRFSTLFLEGSKPPASIMFNPMHIIAAGLFAMTTVAAVPRAPILLPRQENGTDQVTFTSIVPSPEINWVDCYQANGAGFQCTYWTVPLDYGDLEAGTTSVAFVRYFVSEENEDLLLNPGQFTVIKA